MASHDNIMNVSVDEVVVPEGRRPLNVDAVKRLAESIREVGLQHPITVRLVDGKFILVAGHHRLEAVREIGDEVIRASILKCSEIDAKLIEITENLHRIDLSALDRAECIEEWRRLTAAKVFEISNRLKTKQQPNDIGVRKTAEALGIHVGTVSQARRIAEIEPAAKEAGADLSHANLAIVASLPQEQQLAKVIEIKRASEFPKEAVELSAEWRRGFEKWWNKAPDPADREWAREWIDRPLMDARFGGAS